MCIRDSFRLKNSHLVDNNLAEIVPKLVEMNYNNGRVHISADWGLTPEDLNKKLFQVISIFSKAKNLCYIGLDLDYGRLNDQGCLAISQLLRASTTISAFHLYMFEATITDLGISYLASELSSLALQEIHFNLGK
eukprot:TRINITY_DN23245_c0_g1_i2.p1 TRINITY_DN23245_c0_g1~~TRINITY_DN23245_c0_g1_i2.p1  ORF type:complete len:135 (+),score=17.07 TRINITY_DN23245_c0_g1_i2:64-468(+)